MATDIVMPRLSDSMEEGTVLRWLKSPGDEVSVGEELVEIETDKANMVYEAPGAGTLVEIVAQEGDTLPIGEVIARMGEAGEKPSEPAVRAAAGAGAEREAPSSATAEPPSAAPEAPARAAPEAPPEAPPREDGRAKASPLARRIAKENGLQLAAIAGSGPGGRIVKADVERALAAGPAEVAPGAPAAAPPPTAPAEPTPGARERPETAKGAVTQEDLTKLQQTVARRMAESKATAPHFYLSVEVDMSRAVAARGRIKAAAADADVVPSFNDMVVKACAIALREFPRANGAYRDG